MNLRKISLSESLGLMKGSEVPQHKYMYFLELEKIGPEDTYTRSWHYLDNLCQKDHRHYLYNLCQKDHRHIPEVNDIFTKKVRRTRNYKLCRRMYHKQGIIVERERIAKKCNTKGHTQTHGVP